MSVMKQQQFSGTGVALVTPFKNGKIDFAGLEKLINHVIDGGVDYLVSLGTTGEAITQTNKEHRAVLDCTIKINNKRVPLVAGPFGHNNTAELVKKINAFDFEGIDAILSSSPSYNKPTQEGIFQHYMAVENACPVPIIIYNVPNRTASNISAETIVRLANASPNFVAVKEASSNLFQGMQIIKNKPENFLVLSGDDISCFPLIATGGDGVISVLANALPYQFSKMVKASLAHDLERAQELNYLLLDLHKWLYIEGNPTGIKAALELLNICSNEVRLPLVSLTDQNFRQLKKEFTKVLHQSKSNV